jgi:hypothetical protein
MMKLSDDIVFTLVNQVSLPYISYLTACGDKIYQANRDISGITCYTIKVMGIKRRISAEGSILYNSG